MAATGKAVVSEAVNVYKHVSRTPTVTDFHDSPMRAEAFTSFVEMEVRAFRDNYPAAAY